MSLPSLSLSLLALLLGIQIAYSSSASKKLADKTRWQYTQRHDCAMDLILDKIIPEYETTHADRSGFFFFLRSKYDPQFATARKICSLFFMNTYFTIQKSIFIPIKSIYSFCSF